MRWPTDSIATQVAGSRGSDPAPMRWPGRLVTLALAAEHGNHMSAADKRVAELLDRWLASVELHARYLGLDAAAYAKVQAWPKHERPTRWVIDLARTRLNELKRLHAERIAKGDATFAEALELMGFLANLVGSEHVERFIPLATEAPVGPHDRTDGAPQDATRPSARPQYRTDARRATHSSQAGRGPALEGSRGARLAAHDDAASRRGQSHVAGHRRRRADAELGAGVAADCGPDRAARGPAERAGRLEDTAQPPRRDRSASQAPARLSGRRCPPG